MKSFQCDVLGQDGHVSRSVQLLASDGDSAKSEATRLFSWLSPRDRGGGLILRDGATIILRLEATR
jgi:hypothetical protein